MRLRIDESAEINENVKEMNVIATQPVVDFTKELFIPQ